jgi:hypothetical protein
MVAVAATSRGGWWWWRRRDGGRAATSSGGGVHFFFIYKMFAVRQLGARQCIIWFQKCLPCAKFAAWLRVAVRFKKRRTTKALCRAKSCRATFAVRFQENAWQRLCRASFPLCRALETHGKQPVSRSD